jgi:hypothetical protein
MKIIFLIFTFTAHSKITKNKRIKSKSSKTIKKLKINRNFNKKKIINVLKKLCLIMSILSLIMDLTKNRPVKNYTKKYCKNINLLKSLESNEPEEIMENLKNLNYLNFLYDLNRYDYKEDMRDIGLKILEKINLLSPEEKYLMHEKKPFLAKENIDNNQQIMVKFSEVLSNLSKSSLIIPVKYQEILKIQCDLYGNFLKYKYPRTVEECRRKLEYYYQLKFLEKKNLVPHLSLELYYEKFFMLINKKEILKDFKVNDNIFDNNYDAEAIVPWIKSHIYNNEKFLNILKKIKFRHWLESVIYSFNTRLIIEKYSWLNFSLINDLYIQFQLNEKISLDYFIQLIIKNLEKYPHDKRFFNGFLWQLMNIINKTDFVEKCKNDKEKLYFSMEKSISHNDYILDLFIKN